MKTEEDAGGTAAIVTEMLREKIGASGELEEEGEM